MREHTEEAGCLRKNTSQGDPVRERKRKALRPTQCRAHARRELASSFPEIMEGLIECAKAGSLQHVKLVTELLEVRSGKNGGMKRKGPGPLTRVLRELERRESEAQQRGSRQD